MDEAVLEVGHEVVVNGEEPLLRTLQSSAGMEPCEVNILGFRFRCGETGAIEAEHVDEVEFWEVVVGAA